MNKCTECGSYAINHHCHGRDGSDPELCDVCYWRVRATDYAALEAERDHLKACQENAQLHITGLVAERNAALMQRDRLAGLLRHASSVLGIQGWDALTHEIDAALSELTP